MKKKRSKTKRRKSVERRSPDPPDDWRLRDESDNPPKMIFKDSVNAEDYHYLSTDQWNEQSAAARRLRDAIRWVAALKGRLP